MQSALTPTRDLDTEMQNAQVQLRRPKTQMHLWYSERICSPKPDGKPRVSVRPSLKLYSTSNVQNTQPAFVISRYHCSPVLLTEESGPSVVFNSPEAQRNTYRMGYLFEGSGGVKPVTLSYTPGQQSEVTVRLVQQREMFCSLLHFIYTSLDRLGCPNQAVTGVPKYFISEKHFMNQV